MTAPHPEEQLVPPAWFRKFLDRGFPLIHYPEKSKAPIGPEAKGWPSRAVRSPEGYIPGKNWGVLLGSEIAPGRFLVDVDFDWALGLPLAKQILPDTGFGFGRAGNEISHAFFTTPEPIKSRRYEDIDRSVIVELRGRTERVALLFRQCFPRRFTQAVK